VPDATGTLGVSYRYKHNRELNEGPNVSLIVELGCGGCIHLVVGNKLICAKTGSEDFSQQELLIRNCPFVDEREEEAVKGLSKRLKANRMKKALE
jgi:hypothetical protein